LPGLRHNHVQGETNGDEFNCELFEPTNIVEDGEEDDMNATQGLHNENLYAHDDGIIQLHLRGTTTS